MPFSRRRVGFALVLTGGCQLIGTSPAEHFGCQRDSDCPPQQSCNLARGVCQQISDSSAGGTGSSVAANTGSGSTGSLGSQTGSSSGATLGTGAASSAATTGSSGTVTLASTGSTAASSGASTAAASATATGSTGGSTSSSGGTTGGPGPTDGGYCVIGGVNYAPDQTSPDSLCLACMPAFSFTAFTTVATGCGADAGGCTIGGVSMPNWAMFSHLGHNPLDACEACLPAVSVSSWTVVDGGACGVGTCSGDTCTKCNATNALCNNYCFPPYDDDNCGSCGQLCPAGSLCAGGSCTSPSALPTPLSDPGYAGIAGVAYVVGGRNDAGPLAGVEQLNEIDNLWTALNPLPTARYGVAAIPINNGPLLAAGGYAINGAANIATTSELDLLPAPRASSTWLAMPANLPAAVAFAGGVGLGASAGYGPNPRALLVGGENTGVPTAAAEIVQDASYEGWSAFESLPAMTTRPGAVMVKNGLYPTPVALVIGGTSITGMPSSAVLSNFFQADAGWTPHTPWPRARSGAAFASDGVRFVYVVGGLNPDGSSADDFDIYDSVLDSWASGPALPTARTGLALAFDPDTQRLYAIGGYNGQFLNTVEAYVLANDAWTP